MKMSNKVYDVLKWVLLTVVPAFVTLFSVLATTWNWDIPTEAIITSITAVATFLGTILFISNAKYKKTIASGNYDPEENDGDN